MKNLMNRVLVVLTVSAVFAGSINAVPTAAERRAARAKTVAPVATSVVDVVDSGKMALNNISRKGRLDRAYYTLEQLDADIAALHKAVPKAKNEIVTVKNEALVKDDAKRAASFAGTGTARMALNIIQTAMTTKSVEEATKLAKAEPSEENTKNLAIEKITAEADLAETDKMAGDSKSYMSYRNKALVAIGAAGVVVAGLLVTYGAPAFLAPYVPKAMTEYSTSIRENAGAAGRYVYGKAGALGTAMGLGEEGRIGKAARRMGAGASYYGQQVAGYGQQVAGALGVTAATAWASKKLGLSAAENKVQQKQAELNAAIVNLENKTEEITE